MMKGTQSSELPVTIASGEQLSSIAELKGMTLVGIRFPATMSGATVKLHSASKRDGTFIEHRNAAAYTVAFTASTIEPVNRGVADSLLSYVKLFSASAEGAERTIYLIVRDLSA